MAYKMLKTSDKPADAAAHVGGSVRISTGHQWRSTSGFCESPASRRRGGRLGNVTRNQEGRGR